MHIRLLAAFAALLAFSGPCAQAASPLGELREAVDELSTRLRLPQGTWGTYITAEPGTCFEHVQRTRDMTPRRLCNSPAFDDRLTVGHSLPPQAMTSGGFDPEFENFRVTWVDGELRQHDETLALARIVKSMGTPNGTLLVELGVNQIRVYSAVIDTRRPAPKEIYDQYWGGAYETIVLNKALVFEQASRGKLLPSDYFDKPKRMAHPWKLRVIAPTQGCTLLTKAQWAPEPGVAWARDVGTDFLLRSKGDRCYNHLRSTERWATEERLPETSFEIRWVDTQGLTHSETFNIAEALRGAAVYGGELVVAVNDSSVKLLLREPDPARRVVSPSPDHHFDTFGLKSSRELLSLPSPGVPQASLVK